jgi:hypothetical protein
MFSPDGAKGVAISFIDIERALRDCTPPSLRQKPNRLFMNGFLSPLNPLSFSLRA